MNIERPQAKAKSVVEIEGAEGVPVELVHDKGPGNHLPMRATIPYLIDFNQHYKDDGWEEQIEALRKLQAAGVREVPLYESAAREAGLKWRVVE